MEASRFRKLDIELPVQRSYDQRPWLATGLLFAITILLMAAYAFMEYKKYFDVLVDKLSWNTSYYFDEGHTNDAHIMD